MYEKCIKQIRFHCRRGQLGIGSLGREDAPVLVTALAGIKVSLRCEGGR